MVKTVKILGVKITSEKEERILELILNELEKPRGSRRKIVIFTPNPEQLSQAAGNPELKNLLNEADLALADGVGVTLAARILGKPIEARIAGVDFMKSLVKSVSKRPVNTGYLGGQPRVAIEAAECLKKIASGLHVGYASDTYNREKMIESDIDILFVAYGFPKQEEWIMANKDALPATVFMAVGGSFDFLSGRIPRAPRLMRAFGLEWLFRLIIQPWRIFRQARILHFGALILVEALGSRGEEPKK